MNDLSTHDFNIAKNKIKNFSLTIPKPVELKSVQTNSGPFDFFDHNVTGAELNEITSDIQKNFIVINNSIITTIKEFGQVYTALEALDDAYLKKFIVAVEAANEASNQAKKAAEEARENTIDISNLVKSDKKILDVLVKFKDKLDATAHLDHIDQMWINIESIRSNNDLAKTSFHDLRIEISSIHEKQKEKYRFLKLSLIVSFLWTGILTAYVLFNSLGFL